MSLVQFQDDNKVFQLMQNSWGSSLNPILANPLNNCSILKNISLLAASNPNAVNHKLGKKISGWFIIRQRSSSIIWDNQDSNQTPQLTLNLRCSADVTIDLAVF